MAHAISATIARFRSRSIAAGRSYRSGGGSVGRGYHPTRPTVSPPTDDDRLDVSWAARRLDEDDWGQIEPGDGLKPASGNTGRRILVAAVAAALLSAAVTAWFLWPESAPPPPPEPEPVVAVEEPPPEVDLPPLPPLDLSDRFVRALLAALTDHPDALAWLLGDGLVRSIVIAVENVADGNSPRRALAGLGPPAPFSVLEDEEGFIVSPASFARYDGVTAAIADADNDALAAAILRLRPLLEEAYLEVGRPERNFLEALLAALDRLVAAPIPEAPIRLREVTLRYEYESDELERLDAASKHFLRFGPDNQRIVRNSLAHLSAALRASVASDSP